METLLREAKEKHPEIPASLKEQIVLEHTPLIRYIVNRIAVRRNEHVSPMHHQGLQRLHVRGHIPVRWRDDAGHCYVAPSGVACGIGFDANADVRRSPCARAVEQSGPVIDIEIL